MAELAKLLTHRYKKDQAHLTLLSGSIHEQGVRITHTYEFELSKEVIA